MSSILITNGTVLIGPLADSSIGADLEGAPDLGLGHPRPHLGAVRLREHERHTFDRVATVLLPHDWLTLRLTGQFVTDRGEPARWGLEALGAAGVAFGIAASEFAGRKLALDR
mgnify:CR=1 FL=1